MTQMGIYSVGEANARVRSQASNARNDEPFQTPLGWEVMPVRINS
jgi:hypothetical protein